MTPPGLHMLCRTCTAPVEGASPTLAGLVIAPANEQEIALVASVPLSDEPWQPLLEGEVVVLREGKLNARHVPQSIVPQPTTLAPTPG